MLSIGAAHIVVLSALGALSSNALTPEVRDVDLRDSYVVIEGSVATQLVYRGKNVSRFAPLEGLFESSAPINGFVRVDHLFESDHSGVAQRLIRPLLEDARSAALLGKRGSRRSGDTAWCHSSNPDCFAPGVPVNTRTTTFKDTAPCDQRAVVFVPANAGTMQLTRASSAGLSASDGVQRRQDRPPQD